MKEDCRRGRNHSRLAAALAVFMAVGLLAAAVPGAAVLAAETKQTRAEPYRIVALGDSLAAGYEYGMEHQENPVPYGFVERVWEQALFRGWKASYHNYGIIGLRAEGLEKLLARVERGEGSSADDLLAEGQELIIDPRVDSLVGDGEAVRQALTEADLILIQIGGNDFKIYGTMLQEGKEEEAEAWVQEMLDRFEQSLEASIRTIHRINPDALIVIGDQYSPMPKKLLTSEIPYYDKLQDAVRILTSRLEQLSAGFAAEDRDVRTAYSAGRFVGRELSMTTLLASGGTDIHPTQSGYDAIGRAFAEAVWGEYREPAPREADVPITIVVNGRELQPAENKPVVRSNFTFLVLRDIANELGAGMTWDGTTKSVAFTLKERRVVLQLDSNIMTVNGEPRTIPAAPFAENGRTYVPLGALSDALGFDVVYRNTLKTAFING